MANSAPRCANAARRYDFHSVFERWMPVRATTNYPIPRHRSKNERSGDAGLPRGHPNSANRVDLPAKGK